LRGNALSLQNSARGKERTYLYLHGISTFIWKNARVSPLIVTFTDKRRHECRRGPHECVQSHDILYTQSQEILYT
jgi:hypothetical protein